jgi:hypothetical protein
MRLRMCVSTTIVKNVYSLFCFIHSVLLLLLFANGALAERLAIFLF